MIKKVIMALIMISLISFYALTLYYNLPQDPIKLEEELIESIETSMISYGPTPVFAEKLRFNHKNISYSISQDCNEKRKNSMIEAFEIFETEMEIIKFSEDSISPDIIVKCSDENTQTGESLFIAGEGGPSRIINTSNFKTIIEGTIFLYRDEVCNYPIVELHELLHVFGFDHVENPMSIMYNISNCNQRITSDMVETIKNLYEIKALPDARIKELDVIKKGKYLDFNITIINEGMKNLPDLNLTILNEDKIIQIMNIGEIQIGYGRTLSATNVKIPIIKNGEIIFVIDYENSIEELIETNNIKKMKIS